MGAEGQAAAAQVLRHAFTSEAAVFPIPLLRRDAEAIQHKNVLFRFVPCQGIRDGISDVIWLMHTTGDSDDDSGEVKPSEGF